MDFEFVLRSWVRFKEVIFVKYSCERFYLRFLNGDTGRFAFFFRSPGQRIFVGTLIADVARFSRPRMRSAPFFGCNVHPATSAAGSSRHRPGQQAGPDVLFGAYRGVQPTQLQSELCEPSNLGHFWNIIFQSTLSLG